MVPREYRGNLRSENKGVLGPEATDGKKIEILDRVVEWVEDGISYEGMWSNNRKNGQGTLKWVDGSRKYTGNFKDDMRHGYGEYSWEHGSKSYKGNWRNG